VAQSLIDKGEVKYLDGSVLKISQLTQSCSVEISEIPSNMTVDRLHSLLENTRRSGGGRIADIQYSEHSHTALVTFEDHTGNLNCTIIVVIVIFFCISEIQY